MSDNARAKLAQRKLAKLKADTDEAIKNSSVEECSKTDNADTMSSGKVDPDKISSNQLGARLGSGGDKMVFEFGDNKAVGTLKPGKNPAKIDQELQILSQINDLGLPTVNAQRIVVDGKPAILMDRFAQGSKTIVKNNPRKPVILEGADTSLLNDRSISDLKSIRSTLIEKQVKIDDLQFLIGSNGKVVIADPLKVTTEVKPSPVNLRTIDKLIEAASKR